MVDVVEQTADIELQNPVKFPATLARNFLSISYGFVFVASIASSCFPVARRMQHLTRSLCSSSITEPSSLVRIDPPQCSTSVRFASWLQPLVLSPFALERLVPAVPPESLCQIHATFTPVATYPVIRCPAGLSQQYRVPLVLTTFCIIDASSVGLLSLISLTPTSTGITCTLPPTLTTMTLNHSRLGWFDTGL